MIVGETLAGIFLLGSFFASFFTGPQRGSETCTSSFKNVKYKNRVESAEVVTRINRLGSSSNESAMLKKAESYKAKKTVGRTKSKTRRGGMGKVACLLSFIRSAFHDYDVEFDGVIINGLDNNDILIIINDFLKTHKKELVEIVSSELNGSISNKKIIHKINSTQNNIISSLKSNS